LVGTTADFADFCPQRPLSFNHLVRENRRTAGRIGEVRLVRRALDMTAPCILARHDFVKAIVCEQVRPLLETVIVERARAAVPPGRPKGAPVIIFRSEGRCFQVGRCLMPMSHFFKSTGTKSPKQKWKFTKAGED